MKIKNLIIGLILGTLIINGISSASPLDKIQNTNTTKKQVIKVSLPFNHMFFLVPRGAYDTANTSSSLNWLGVFLFNNIKNAPSVQYRYTTTASIF